MCNLLPFQSFILLKTCWRPMTPDSGSSARIAPRNWLPKRRNCLTTSVGTSWDTSKRIRCVPSCPT